MMPAQHLIPLLSPGYKPVGPTWRSEVLNQVSHANSIYVHHAPNDSQVVVQEREQRRQQVLGQLNKDPKEVPDDFVATQMIDDFRWDYVKRLRHVYQHGFPVKDKTYADIRSQRGRVSKSHQFDFLGSDLESESVIVAYVDSHPWKVVFPHFATNPLDVVLLWMCLPERAKDKKYLPNGALLMTLKEKLEAQGDVQAKLVASIIPFSEIADGLYEARFPSQSLTRPICVSPLSWSFHRAKGHPYENVIHDFFHLEKMADVAQNQSDLLGWRRRQRKIYDAFDASLARANMRDISTNRMPTVGLRELLLEGESLGDIKKLEVNPDIRTRLNVPLPILLGAFQQIATDSEMQGVVQEMLQYWTVLQRYGQ